MGEKNIIVQYYVCNQLPCEGDENNFKKMFQYKVYWFYT